MGKVAGCELCDEYEACLHDEAVNNFVKRKAFRDEWKLAYQSMLPSKVLDFLRSYEKNLREKYKMETDKFDSQTLRLCLFINAVNAYPGKKITKTLRNSLIKSVASAIDFIPTLKTQLDDKAVNTLVELTDRGKKQELYQEEAVQRLLQISNALRENPQTNLMARYEINREFSELLKEGQYASPQVAEYFLEESNDWYELTKISEAIEWIEMAKLIFNRLEWYQEVEKCERIIVHLKNLPNGG